MIWSLQSEDSKRPSFIFGTFHLGFTGQDLFVQALKPFIETCTSFYGETNLTELTQSFRMPKSKLKFSEYFTPSQISRIRRQSNSFRLIPMNVLMSIHPMASISVITSNILGNPHQGLDYILWSWAEKNCLAMNGIESVDEQAQYFSEIPEEVHWKQLKSILFNLTGYRQKIEQLTNLYRKQAVHQLYQNTRKDLGTMRQLMINKRNPIMIERIANLLQNSDDPLFICLGAAHLSGIHGILHGLKLRNHIVKPVDLFR